MNLGLNKGSKIRTILRIATSLNTALCVTQVGIGNIGNNTLVYLWMILTIVTDFVVSFITTYYNNDYTEIASKNTGRMRQEKEEQAEDYIGENFNEQ